MVSSDTPSAAAFAASWRLVVACAACGLAAATGGVVLDDPGGRLLLVPAALLLLGGAVGGALLRPVLRVGPEGVDVRDGLRLVRLPWSEELTVRVSPQHVRLARADWLQVDAPEVLVLLHPLLLGARAEDVAREVARRRSVYGR